MEAINPWFITGFCDGEAAFTYSRGSGTFAMYFSITQTEVNRELVEKIHEYFEYVGKIYSCKSALSTKNSGFTKPSIRYRVTRTDELTVITEHFDKYPLLSRKKLEAYRVWREMVMHKLENYRNINYDTLRKLAEKLSSLNMQGRAFKVHSR